MKMKRWISIVGVALLTSVSANATVVFNDIFDGGAGGGINDLSVNLAARQAAGITMSDYSNGGTPNGYMEIFSNVSTLNRLVNPVGGDHNTIDLNTDFGPSLVGNIWTLNYDEKFQNSTAGGPGGFGGWAGIFVGKTRGFGTDFGLILRPDGAYSIFNGTTEIAGGGAGSLATAGSDYHMEIRLDETANTVSVSQGTIDLGTHALVFVGSSRFVQFRTHIDGVGSPTSFIDAFQDNVTIEVTPVLPPSFGGITVEQLPGTNGLAVTWGTDAGSGYAVQKKMSLLDESWTNYISRIVGTGENVTVTTAVDQAKSFYRVILDDYIQAPVGMEYLVFELTNVPLWDFDRAVGGLVTDLGTNNPAFGKMYGFGMNAIPLLTRSVAVLNSYVNEVFDVAEAHGVPAYFHIDPLYGFETDNIPPGEEPTLQYWDHPEMCEWVNFPGAGQTSGQIPRVWINWGNWVRIGQALPNFESPTLQQFYKSQLEDGILKPIKQRLLALQKEGKGYLFAGVNIGWETHLLDRSAQAGQTIVAVNTGETMLAWEQAKTGYAALYTKGWDDASLTAEAAAQGISKDELFYDLCAESVQSNMLLLAKTASDYGFFKSQIFSHIVALQSTATHIHTTDTEIPPIWSALNDYCTPGFTLDEFGAAKYDLAEMENIFNAHGHPFKYAPIESYLVHYQTEAEYTTRLGGFFADADLVAVFGAVLGLGGTPSAYTMNADQAAAISNWLSAP